MKAARVPCFGTPVTASVQPVSSQLRHRLEGFSGPPFFARFESKVSPPLLGPTARRRRRSWAVSVFKLSLENSLFG